jgi:malonate-semialdehyde dehydrogenase (acetylating) / methylmalonate-semialdehyde dehydrogenase
MTTTALETVAHWIGGERLHEASRYGEVTDPATGAVTRRVAFASAADVDRAVAAATAGFQTWSAQSLTKRAAVLFRFRELLAANAS